MSNSVFVSYDVASLDRIVKMVCKFNPHAVGKSEDFIRARVLQCLASFKGDSQYVGTWGFLILATDVAYNAYGKTVDVEFFFDAYLFESDRADETVKSHFSTVEL